MPEIRPPCELEHRRYGRCKLLRMEGGHWLVEFGQIVLRIAPADHGDFSLVEPAFRLPQTAISPEAIQLRNRSEVFENDNPPTGQPTSRVAPLVSPADQSPSPVTEETGNTFRGVNLGDPIEAHQKSIAEVVANPLQKITEPIIVKRGLLRRAIRSLGTGLTPPDSRLTQFLSVGLKEPFAQLDAFHQMVAKGGAAMVVRGAYGCGKTFMLQSALAKSIEANFVSTFIEINNSDTRLDQAPSVYASLIQGLKFPTGGQGLSHLLDLFSDWLASQPAPKDSQLLYAWLNEKTQCEYLAWMLSDRELRSKSELVAALSGKTIRTSLLYEQHKLGKYGARWPYFKYGTQGDVASFLISGISRLINLIGFSGLVICLDEMEKWRDLDLEKQYKASNLLGGLIWGATADQRIPNCEKHRGKRICSHHNNLKHSHFNEGAPFSTRERCYLGLICAITPRGLISPEHKWQEFGEITTLDLPSYTPESFCKHFLKVAKLFSRAYAVDVPHAELLIEAERAWRESPDRSARYGAQAITETLENWRTNHGT